MALTVAQIDTAIVAILESGQSVSVDGVSYSKASLSALQALRDRVAKIESASNRPLVRAMNFRGMGYS